MCSVFRSNMARFSTSFVVLMKHTLTFLAPNSGIDWKTLRDVEAWPVAMNCHDIAYILCITHFFQTVCHFICPRKDFYTLQLLIGALSSGKDKELHVYDPASLCHIKMYIECLAMLMRMEHFKRHLIYNLAIIKTIIFYSIMLFSYHFEPITTNYHHLIVCMRAPGNITNV